MIVSDKMIEKFDIDFVISNFQATNLEYYFGLLKKMSNADLRQLRKQVNKHKCSDRQHPAFANVRHLSTRDAIVSGINHELLTRSWRYPLFKLLLHLRTPIVKAFTGLELKEHQYFGTLYWQPKRRHHYYMHMPHYEFFPLIGRFWLSRWPIILPIIVAAAVALFIHFDSKSTSKTEKEKNKSITNDVRHK